MTEGTNPALKSSQWDYDYTTQSSQVNGQHVLDEIDLQLNLNTSDDNSSDNNNHQNQSNIDNNNNIDDTHSICTFKSTKSKAPSNKSDDLHEFMFSTTNTNHNKSHQKSKKKKRKYKDIINENNNNNNYNQTILINNNTNSQISIHTISSSSSNGSFQTITTTYNTNKNKKRKINENNSNKHRNNNNNNINKWRWDPHIYSGNKDVCFRIKGLYYPSQIQIVTNEYFLVETINPTSKKPMCFKFKYSEYIKDRYRIIPLNNASQLTQTQTQNTHSQFTQINSQINTQQLLQSPIISQQNDIQNENEISDQNNNCISDENMCNESDNNSNNKNINKNDSIKRVTFAHTEEQILPVLTSDNSDIESIESSPFDMNTYRRNHNRNNNRNNKNNKWKKKDKKRRRKRRLSDSDSDSDSDSENDNSDNNNKKNKKSSKKLVKKVVEIKNKNKKVKKRRRVEKLPRVRWTKKEENALIEGYRKYREYENEPMFKPGVCTYIMKDEKYKKIFKVNKRTNGAIRTKWSLLNKKRKLTEKWDKEENDSNDSDEESETDSSQY